MRIKGANGKFVANDPKTAFDEKWRLNEKSGCWEWVQSASRDHYGNFGCKALGGSKNTSAHRASWMIHKGPIPSGLLVLHRCDNQLCVNPEHLFLGTNSDNQKDAYAKGRKKRFKRPMPGVTNPAAKLNDDLVREMRKLREEGWVLKKLSQKFSISIPVAHKIVRREIWKHVT
ncbi:MAG TPA: HNH endonuclease signature motif containing protein [Burkholderiales bacterium]|jgi:hypothetical protein|nr:HNH endonuclease signature motif containing protein [Burkholderiales bacterium]